MNRNSKDRPHTVINTVGTSLFTNIEHAKPDNDLHVAKNSQDWGELARRLRKRSSDERICGAEINSIASLISRNLLAPNLANVHFCVSDTEDGRHIGIVLKSYYEQSGHNVTIHKIEELQDENPELFRTSGLRNLVRCIGKIVRNTGANYVAINATGGYKAQIAVAVLIGQVLGIRVFYKHERFDTIVPFPPMPISFDWELLGRYADLISALEENEILTLPADDVPEELKPLLDEASDTDGLSLWALAPIGQIYLEGFRYHYPIQQTLPPEANDSDRSPPTFRDDHYPQRFKDFVNSVWKRTPYCKTCRSLPYDRQPSIRDRRFFVRQDGTIIGEFRDRNQFGGRFAIDTTATSTMQRIAVVADLNERFGKK